MPYIKKKQREYHELGFPPRNPGELNYAITKEILKYLSSLNYNKLAKSKKISAVNSYADYNEVMGVLECVKQELYRRLIVPYENKKRKENGDVF